MRITNSVMVNSFLTDMNTNLNSLNKIQRQLNTGKVFSKPSDNPFKVARSMQMYSEINANKQYNTNIKDTINWMDTTDTALNNVNKALSRIRELMVSAGNAAYGSSELKAIKDEVNEKVSEIGQLLNTSFDGKYVFGGKEGSERPVDVTSTAKATQNSAFGAEVAISGLDKYTGTAKTMEVTNLDTAAGTVEIDGTSYPLTGNKATVDGMELDFTDAIAAGAASTTSWSITVDNKKNSLSIAGNEANIDQKLQVEISSGVTVDYNVNAVDILKFTDTKGNAVDVMDFFDDLINNLSSVEGKEKVAGENLDTLDTVINNLLSVSSKVGTIQNRMESAQLLNEAQNENMTEILSSNEDVDIVEKTMELANAQTVYLASLQTSAKVIQPTLLDYL